MGQIDSQIQQQRTIHAYLMKGGWHSAVHLNRIGHTGDARKITSRLRRKGMHITDRWQTSPDGARYKEYHYVPEPIVDNKVDNKVNNNNN